MTGLAMALLKFYLQKIRIVVMISRYWSLYKKCLHQSKKGERNIMLILGGILGEFIINFTYISNQGAILLTIKSSSLNFSQFLKWIF